MGGNRQERAEKKREKEKGEREGGERPKNRRTSPGVRVWIISYISPVVEISTLLLV